MSLLFCLNELIWIIPDERVMLPSQTTEYWEKYERESLLVNADQETQTTKESLGMLVEAATTVDTTLEAAQVPTGTRISNEVAKWMNMFLVIPASPFPITSAGKST